MMPPVTDTCPTGLLQIDVEDYSNPKALPPLFFNARTEQLGALSLRYAVPAIFAYHEFAAAGDLLCYGANEAETYRLFGNYVGKILSAQ
jgi:hypothetical protein